MKNFFLIFSLILLSSCGSAKRSSKKGSTSNTSTKTTKVSNKTKAIINYALDFKGTRYKYGGTTKRGMDCSGLIFTSFNAYNVSLPRVSSDMVKTGDWVDIKTVKPGDLVFFATRKNSRRINHVGLVTKVKGDDFSFVHSTTSKGVVESSIKERYWYLAYVQARRIL